MFITPACCSHGFILSFSAAASDFDSIFSFSSSPTSMLTDSAAIFRDFQRQDRGFADFQVVSGRAGPLLLDSGWKPMTLSKVTKWPKLLKNPNRKGQSLYYCCRVAQVVVTGWPKLLKNPLRKNSNGRRKDPPPQNPTFSWISKYFSTSLYRSATKQQKKIYLPNPILTLTK